MVFGVLLVDVLCHAVLVFGMMSSVGCLNFWLWKQEFLTLLKELLHCPADEHL